MAARQYHLKFGGNAAASVDAYAEYKRLDWMIQPLVLMVIKTRGWIIQSNKKVC